MCVCEVEHLETPFPYIGFGIFFHGSEAVSKADKSFKSTDDEVK